MSKFKIGDKVRVRKDAPRKNWTYDMDNYVNCVMTVRNVDSYNVLVEENEWFWNFENIEPAEPKETIVIYREDNETIGILKRNGEEVKRSSATCSPADTYSLETGAKLVVDRLYAPELYSHRLVCTEECHSFKLGRIYEVKDGVLYGDNGYTTMNGIFEQSQTPYTCLEEINKDMAAKFIELIED